uniref:Uncharacterized protein n=1 Tax=Physcomitrium patens TaxID=3218 RepID=A0A2K1J9R4_PHYPA|nr:hypothetical protein PHYPA_021377 [Physcomitrium patens]
MKGCFLRERPPFEVRGGRALRSQGNSGYATDSVLGVALRGVQLARWSYLRDEGEILMEKEMSENSVIATLTFLLLYLTQYWLPEKSC